MKKVLFLALCFSAAITTTTYAQSGPTANVQSVSNPAAILQQMKEKTVPQMVEKTGITKEQAEKIVEVNFETRMAAAGLRDLSEADRTKKIAELKAAKEKKYSEILTADQIKAVAAFYEDMGKNMQKPTN